MAPLFYERTLTGPRQATERRRNCQKQATAPLRVACTATPGRASESTISAQSLQQPGQAAAPFASIVTMPIFAKIQGKTLYADNDDDEELPDINLDITHTKVFLGRADTYPADESLGPHMGTCHSKSVSRRHLTISWDPDRDQWQLYVDSKNGVVVDCVEIEATARPSWLGRAVRNEHHHAIEQASRRWRGGRRDDSARTRRKI